MVIYTIYPIETVLKEEAQEKRSYFSLESHGRTFILELVDGQAQIVRLISPNPQDYLNPRWQPGSKFGLSVPD